jgi:mannitol/fructose-specific phosphotransferase system IIA component (Ntr-type)
MAHRRGVSTPNRTNELRALPALAARDMLPISSGIPPAKSQIMAVSIAQLLDPSRVALELRETRRSPAIHEVARMLEGNPDLENFHAFYNELLARERVEPTCIGNEVALPHARTEHASRIVLAVGRSTQGVTFDSSGQLVRLIFVIATPKSMPMEYLLVVGHLCRLLKDSSLRDTLMTAKTSEEFITAIATAEGAQTAAH